MAKFKSEIDKLRAGVPSAGGDEPEMCLTGILNALKECERNSLIYVYTDAPPKDLELMTQVQSLAKEKESKTIFLLTRVFRQKKSLVHRRSRSLRDSYISIAGSSGGTVVTTTKTEIKNVTLDLINAEEISKSAVDLVNVSMRTPPSTPTSTLEFTLDLSISHS